mmetsp:Transcript_39443/g.70560  ORF Transcript_39443/g.70560 Transcript_39443/m.70560 type:complete len:129 (-) Transcript_39443:27-413(-)
MQRHATSLLEESTGATAFSPKLTSRMKTFREMICADDEDDFVCGYPLYVDSKTREPFVLELYRARGAAAKDLVTNRLRHDALSILRRMIRERSKPDMMHYPEPLQACAPLLSAPAFRPKRRHQRSGFL